MVKIKPSLLIICLLLGILLIAAILEMISPGIFFVVSTCGFGCVIAMIAIILYFGKLDLTSEQHAHSQKLQSLGHLSSAIAHDFNNLLTVIIGNSDLLLSRHPHGDNSYKEAYQIKANAMRGAKLVSQLLSFARKSSIEPANIDIANLLEELTPLFSQLLSEKYNLSITKLGKKEAIIYADPIQLEQIIINLVTNARDAMPNGGNIAINTSLAKIGEKYNTSEYYNPHKSKSIEPGQYVRIEVSDSGTGIAMEILPKIFDPFFSTKESSGTGLGLSTVSQIVEKIGGYILVKTQKNIGTSFVIYIKQIKGEVGRSPFEIMPEKEIEIDSSAYNILLVEDEDPVRMFGAHALNDFGFNVIDVRTAEEALEVIKQGDKKIDLLITDITLGSMDGMALAKLIKEQVPDIKVIITSGYEESSIGDLQLEYTFLSKPYTLKELTSTATIVVSSEEQNHPEIH